MRQIAYVKFNNFKGISLEKMYEGTCIDNLDYNLAKIIETEAPITLNILKERLREALNVGKISQKALDIINERISYLGFKKTDNFYDITLWPTTGKFEISNIRMSNRQIYDISIEELKPLCFDLKNKGIVGEEFKREILKFFGYEVLTKKAFDYLDFIERNYNKR